VNKKKHLVVILVPSAKSKLFKIKIPYKYLNFGIFLGIFVFFFFAFVIFRYISLSMQIGRVEDLISENSELNRVNSQLQIDLDGLVQRVESLDSTKRKLFKMMDISPSESGLGNMQDIGEFNSKYPQPLIEKSRYILEQNEKHFGQLEPIIKTKVAYLSSIPSIWPVRGYITGHFGYRTDPFTKKWTMHTGIDISGKLGTPIKATADGVVIESLQRTTEEKRKGLGNYITIQHRFGYITKYGHLDSTNVKKFKTVKRGDIIGFMGSTGRSTSVHLHYEVYFNSIRVNPIDYVLDD
jgi:murein DD-endopeptidase MepM/ murein hydrolase activator NlpD